MISLTSFGCKMKEAALAWKAGVPEYNSEGSWEMQASLRTEEEEEEEEDEEEEDE